MDQTLERRRAIRVEPQFMPAPGDVMAFERDGFWVGPKPILAGDAVEALREAMDRVYSGVFETGVPPRADYWRPGGDPSALRKSDFTWKADYTIRSVVLSSALGEMAARLLACETVKVWGDQLLYKPGGGAEVASVGWHQDYWYWRLASAPRMLTAWIALDDVDGSNGCMQFASGSHRWGLIRESGNYFDPDRRRQEEMLATAGREVRAVSCHLRAGEVSFHHCLTLHGSGPNLTDAPRRSLAVHLMDGDLLVVHNPENPFFTEETAERLAREGLLNKPFRAPSYPQTYPELAGQPMPEVS